LAKDDISIASLSGDQLIQYLHTLSQKQSAYSKLKIKATEELIPIQQAMAAKKAEIQTINEKQRQCRIEISACKYAIKAEAESLA